MRVSKKLLLVLLPVTLLGVLLEGVAHVIDPDPPVDSAAHRTALFNDTFYVPDTDLIVRLRPGLRSNFKLIREDVEALVTINSEGFRGAEAEPPDAQALRIAVFGDSVTFGLHLAEQDCWPVLMQQRLATAAGGRRVQVRNYGVPGYSTFQGRILFERHVLAGDFKPHVVVFAFGFNDSYLRDIDDRGLQQVNQAKNGTVAGRIGQVLQKSRFLRLLMRPAAREPDHLRVPPDQLRDNLDAVARGAKQCGAELVLVNACLPSGYPHAVMADAARAHGVLFVDCRTVFTRAKGLPVAEPWPRDGTVRIEVPLPGVPIPKAVDARPMVYVLLVPDATQRLTFRMVAMRDDGNDGDVVAGDGTWSCLVSLPAGSRPEFVFGAPGMASTLPQMASNPGILNGFHQLDLLLPAPAPGGAVETVRIPQVLVSPWEDLVMTPDPIHPNPKGSAIVAAAIAEQVLASAAWQQFVK